MYKVIINKGKEKQLIKHHPWVFTGAIESVEPSFSHGDWADVYSYDGTFIAKGWYDEKSHIVLHLLSWNKKEILDDNFIAVLVKNAVFKRKNLLELEDTNCLRLIHGDADYLPGLAVDLYAKDMRLIISSRFINDHLNIVLKTLASLLSPSTMNVRSDAFYASSEGLSNKIVTYDKNINIISDKDDNILFVESGIYYEIERGNGQKSGFYCDQRENRKIVSKYSKDKTVLDACCFTGSFTLHALKGGAKEVLSLDSSKSALRHLLYQVHLNENKGTIKEGSREKVSILEGDVFDEIRKLEEGKFDLMILDPPKLAQTKSKLENALKAYKDLNRVAMQKIKNGGLIASFSCSGAVKLEDFKKVIAYAAADLKIEIQVINILSAGEDHPIRLSCPETEYLKGVVYRVIK